MAQDANFVLQASATKTATFNGAWLSCKGLLGVRDAWAHVLYSAASNASGSNTVTYSLDVSPDGGSTVYAAAFSGVDQALTLSTTAQGGELAIPFNLIDKTLIAGANPSIRLTCTITGAGTSPTVTYSGYVANAFN